MAFQAGWKYLARIHHIYILEKFVCMDSIFGDNIGENTLRRIIMRFEKTKATKMSFIF